MNELTKLIKADMLPALGVTEPGAIAFSVAKARSYTKGELKHVNVAMNSGMYKNAFTCGIPNSNEVGNVFAAALGYVAGNAEKGLESLADVKPEDNVTAQKLIDEGKITVELSGITSRIFIQATVETESNKAIVTIRDSHTNITKIEVNGEVLEESEAEHAADTTEADAKEEVHSIHGYTLKEILEYVETVPIEEIEFVKEAYKVNLELFHEGLENDRSWIGFGINCMPHTIDKTGMIKRILVKKSAKIICDFIFVRPVFDFPFHFIEHFNNLNIRTTVPGTFQGTDCSGNDGIGIGERGGHNMGREGRVITTTMFHM